MNKTDEIVTKLEGPKGTAVVVEVPVTGGSGLEYQVRFGAVTETYKSMGEAYIAAKEKAGVTV